MADNKKYYYMRLKENFFDSSEISLLESMPDGYLYSTREGCTNVRQTYTRDRDRVRERDKEY